jgi:hypothetical protein
MKKARVEIVGLIWFKGMFVGNGKNSTNSVSKALGIFIRWFEREKL